MEIKTKSILEKLEMIKEIEDIQQEDLDKIDELNITGKDFNNDTQTVDFNDLKLFPNLKNLSIEYSTIDYDCIDIIRNYELKNLSFISCEFDSDLTNIKSINTENIYISNCYDFDFSFINNKEFNEVNISTETIRDKININCNKLNLEHCEIENPEVLRGLNIKELIISTIQYEENPTVYENLGYPVTVMDEDSEFVYTKLGEGNE
ncbi:MAG: hypothetical protein IJL76_03375 [Bacilli bacterium]|nr:hypothetical protein [Bacilli bacterium]